MKGWELCVRADLQQRKKKKRKSAGGKLVIEPSLKILACEDKATITVSSVRFRVGSLSWKQWCSVTLMQNNDTAKAYTADISFSCTFHQTENKQTTTKDNVIAKISSSCVSIWGKIKPHYTMRCTTRFFVGWQWAVVYSDNKKSTQAFHTRCLRRLLRISYYDHKTNDWVRSKINFLVARLQ